MILEVSLLNSNRKSLVIFLFLLVSPFLQSDITAQEKGVIKGVVTDAASGSALPGASISVIGTQLGASTNNNGNYILTLAPGKYTLQASYVGYKFVMVSSQHSVLIIYKTKHLIRFG